ncbi:MAG: SDR family oxidoreductase [Phycisphaeraceae bacterium]|nr:SDR family oxidoreductase [Phycisphaeraceae bacterium]
MDRVVIITGAARGIGYGIGQCFAKTGATLVIADVNLEAARKAAAQLDAEGAKQSMGLACDVTNIQQVQAMVDDAIKRYGRIDVLVNNAGICPFIDGMEMSPAVWQKTMDVNVNGAFYCIQAAAKHMIERGKGGRIVSITSLAENVTGPAQVDYAASKAAMRMLTVGMATRLGKHGITCNCVAPGMILTDMTRHYWEQPGPAEMIKTRVPVGRIGTPTDIGHAVVFLASPEAYYISGITLRVDGGHQAVCN